MSIVDVNRVFLQAVMSRRSMPDDLVKILCKKSFDAVNIASKSNLIYNDDKFEQIVGDINESLRHLDLQLKSAVNQSDEKKIWCLVNLKGDEIAQTATQYTAPETQYFKLIIDMIIQAPNESFCVSSIAALREVANLKGKPFTKSQAEIVLQSFVANDWLCQSQKGRYTLSTRSLLELERYLKDSYEEDVLFCASCGTIVTKGLACYELECPVRMHTFCFERYCRARRGDGRKCPQTGCKSDWTTPENIKMMRKVGEEAAREGDDRVRSNRTPQKSSSQGEEEEDEPEPEDDPQDDDVDEEAPQSKPAKGKSSAPANSSQKTGKKAVKGKRRNAPQSDDEANEGAMDVDDQVEDEEEEPTQPKPSRKSRR